MKNKKKLLAMLLLGAAVGVSAVALGGCSDKNNDKNKGDNPGGDTEITDPDTPLDQGGCKHEGASHVSAVSAGCVTGGNKEYWYCASCGKYYSDSALTVETSLASVTLGAVGHSYGDWSNGTPAGCTTDGEKAHKDCTVCHKHFDAENNEITDLVIDAGHSYGEWIAEVPAQGCTDGVHGHYHCDGCGSDFNEEHEEFGNFPWQAGPLKITAPHNIKHYEAEEASCTVDGHDEYWQCEDCETYFDQYGNVAFEEPLFTPGDHDYGEFVYDYTDKKYVKTCKHESTHTVVQAAGTAEYPYLAKDEQTLKEAIALGGHIKLADNIALNAELTVSSTVSIDLNGKTLTAAKNVTFTAKEGGSLSFLNGKLVMSNSKASNASLYVEKGSSVTLDGVSMKTNSYGIFPAGDAASVIVKDSVIRATSATAIGTNAKTVDNYNVIITIENSTLFGYFEAMLINVPGTINATNSTFYGINRAIVLRSGTAKLTDCTLQDNVSALDDEGNITRCLTTTTNAAGTFNSYYDVTQSGSWGSGNVGIPLNVLVVGNGKGSYVNQASCELIGCTLVDDFVGITGTDAEFVHHTIYATTDGTDGAVANVIYDAATAEKSTNFTFKADNAATINQTVA